MHFGSYIDDEKDHCMSSDGFARFLGLLESIPLHNSGHSEHATSDTRWVSSLVKFKTVILMFQ